MRFRVQVRATQPLLDKGCLEQSFGGSEAESGVARVSRVWVSLPVIMGGYWNRDTAQHMGVKVSSLFFLYQWIFEGLLVFFEGPWSLGILLFHCFTMFFIRYMVLLVLLEQKSAG